LHRGPFTSRSRSDDNDIKFLFHSSPKIRSIGRIKK
jgi:hypothetical protein